MLATLAPTVCTEPSCQDATSHEDTCECSCAGVDHGINHRVGLQVAKASVRARIARTGDVFLGAGANDDEEW